MSGYKRSATMQLNRDSATSQNKGWEQSKSLVLGERPRRFWVCYVLVVFGNPLWQYFRLTLESKLAPGIWLIAERSDSLCNCMDQPTSPLSRCSLASY